MTYYGIEVANDERGEDAESGAWSEPDDDELAYWRHLDERADRERGRS